MKQVSAGERHSVALTFAGDVFSWGYARNGALGLPLISSATVSTPRPIAALRGGPSVVEVSAGGAHTLVRLQSGEVLAFGRGTSGELGCGVPADKHSPGAVALPVGARAVGVSAGASHSLALMEDGSVLAWGANQSGQLGRGDTVDASTPFVLALPASSTARAVAAGGHSSMVVDGRAVGTPVPPTPATISLGEVRRLVGARAWGELSSRVETVFSSAALLNASFAPGALQSVELRRRTSCCSAPTRRRRSARGAARVRPAPPRAAQHAMADEVAPLLAASAAAAHRPTADRPVGVGPQPRVPRPVRADGAAGDAAQPAPARGRGGAAHARRRDGRRAARAGCAAALAEMLSQLPSSCSPPASSGR